MIAFDRLVLRLAHCQYNMRLRIAKFDQSLLNPCIQKDEDFQDVLTIGIMYYVFWNIERIDKSIPKSIAKNRQISSLASDQQAH